MNLIKIRLNYRESFNYEKRNISAQRIKVSIVFYFKIQLRKRHTFVDLVLAAKKKTKG